MNTERYFDWAATAPADEEVLRASLDFALSHWANPSSQHLPGTQAKKALATCRERVAAAMGIQPGQAYFTSGGTEGDHIALLSLLTRPSKGSVVISQVEHPAVREMAKSLECCGWHVIPLAPDQSGFVTVQELSRVMRPDTAAVFVMAVNNETGAIQPIYDIADFLVSAGNAGRKPFFHVDCVQAAGKVPLDITHRGIDSAAFSAHKLGGPRGTGLLYLAKPVTPFLRGGGQEGGIRSGTENLLGAHAMALCMEKHYMTMDAAANPAMHERFTEQQVLTRQFVDALRLVPNCTVIPHSRGTQADAESFSPWIVQAAFKGIPGQVLVRAMSADGFCISTGSACSSSKNSRPVLDAMKVSAQEKEAAVRFSFGRTTTREHMQALIGEVMVTTAKFCH